MLNSVYRDAITNRDAILSVIKGVKFEEIKKEARTRWVEYTPTKESITTAGIDSSFNNTKFQGIDLWAVTAISIKENGDILADRHESGLGSDVPLSSMSSQMEMEACKDTIDQVDLVLMDGSLYSQFMSRQPKLDAEILRIMRKRDNVIFISKTSNTRQQFASMGSQAGDIFYYNHVTKRSGFSKVFVERRYGQDKLISTTFVRLSDSTPIIKLEFLGDNIQDTEIKHVMDRIAKHSIGGYPYSLKLAHNKCKISDKELTKMSNMLGLNNEIGSREVLL